jgi:hypothetical protein
MAYRIARIDVHRKKLAVVIADVEVHDEYQFERRWYGTRTIARTDEIENEMFGDRRRVPDRPAAIRLWSWVTGAEVHSRMSVAAGWRSLANCFPVDDQPSTVANGSYLVLVSTSMGLVAEPAKRRRLRVVHMVAHRFQRLEICEHRHNIRVRHFSVGVPRHDLIELPCPDESRADCLCEHGLVVVRNPRRVESDVGAHHSAPRSIQNEPAGKVHARQWLPVSVLWCMAVGASGHGGQVFSALFRSRNIGFRHRSVQRLGALRIRYFTGKIRCRLPLVHGR